jgi:transketolase
MSLQSQLESPLARLDEMARRVRMHIVAMTGLAGSGHPGGSLSVVEVLVTLYGAVMRHDPQRPDWPERDRLVLSKGHAAPALYAVLAEMGYFPTEYLSTLRRLGSPLQGHPDMRRTPGVDMSTGSLGLGLSVGNGMALSARLDKSPFRVYVILGDGECDAGPVWEAAMAAAHYRLDNLVAVIDRNGLQIDGTTEEVMSLELLADKWRAFGWHVIDVVDGHSIPRLYDAFGEARDHRGAPTVVIAPTVKGKGVSFMENVLDFHGKAPTQAQVELALAELRGEAS